MSFPLSDVQSRVEKALGGALDTKMAVHEVRLVAPNKKMLCLSFRVPTAVAFAPRLQEIHSSSEHDTAGKEAEQQSKRQRTLT